MRATRTSVVAPLLLVALAASAVACGRGGDGASGAASDLSAGTQTLAAATTIAATTSGPAYSDQADVVATAGGSQYLVAWAETHLATSKRTIAAARVGSDGKVLDDESIALPSLPGGDDEAPAIAFDGASYLLVWSHKTASGSVIAGTRIGSDGHILDAQPFTLGRANANATAPSVAHSAGGYLVTWTDDRDKGATADTYVTEVYGARISTAGAVVGSSEGFRISNAPGTIARGASIAAAGSTYLVAYAKKATKTETFAIRVSDAGAPAGEPLAFGSADLDNVAPSVASDGDEFLVAWSTENGGPQKVLGTRVSKDGAKLDETPITISTSNAVAPAVAWDGDAFAVAWTHGVQRVGADGALVGAALPGVAASTELRPAVAGSGANLLVVHLEERDAARGVPTRATGTLFAKNGGSVAQADIALARQSSIQRSLATAGHGKTSLSVWLEYDRSWTTPKLNGALYESDGTTSAIHPIAIDSAASPNSAPSVVFDGTTYVVAWEAMRSDGAASSKVAHVNTAGAVVDTPKTFGGGAPKLVAGPASDVFVLTDDLHGHLVTGGNTSPTLERTPDAAGWTTGPVAAPVWDGNRYVLAWSATKDGTTEIRAQRFDKVGHVMDVPPAKIATLAFPNGARPPVVSAMPNGNGETLIAFEDPTARQIKGARLGPTGVSDPSPALLSNATNAAEPRLAWDGFQWILTYEHRLDMTALSPTGSALELTRVRATSSGLAAAGAPQAIVSRGWRPVVSGAGANGATFVSYEALAAGDLAGPRAAFSFFVDTSAPAVTPPGSSSSSGGTTAGDDDDDGRPLPPAGDDDDDSAPSGKKPSGPKSVPTKSATIKPIANGTNGSGGDDGGCAMSPRGAASSAPFFFLALGALVVRRRRR